MFKLKLHLSKKEKQFLSQLKNEIMTTLEEVKANLEATNEKLDNITGDIAKLNEKIQSLTADQEAIDALKVQSAALLEKATGVDEQTP